MPKHVLAKDKNEMYQDLKFVFDNLIETLLKITLTLKVDSFCNKWQNKYPNLNKYFKSEDFDYNHKVRRYIYTTNSIKSVNVKIKKPLEINYLLKSQTIFLIICSLLLKNTRIKTGWFFL